MYPAPFEYHAPSTVAEVLALLERYPDDAKVIAGSQSLVPLMKFRLTSPKHLVDLRKVPGMVGVWGSSGTLQIGALTTHRAIEHSELARSQIPVVCEAAAEIGDAQVRNMGTIGGSLAHADPSADWPAVTLALDASVQLVGRKGERSVKVEEFIVGPLTTSLEPSELIAQVRIPIPGARTGAAYQKLPHPASRFAVVGVAALLTLDAKGAVSAARVAVTGLGSKVTRAAAVEKALIGKAPDAAALKAAAAQIASGIELRADLLGSADYKGQMAAVTAEKALTRAAARASGR